METVGAGITMAGGCGVGGLAIMDARERGESSIEGTEGMDKRADEDTDGSIPLERASRPLVPIEGDVLGDAGGEGAYVVDVFSIGEGGRVGWGDGGRGDSGMGMGTGATAGVTGGRSGSGGDGDGAMEDSGWSADRIVESREGTGKGEESTGLSNEGGELDMGTSNICWGRSCLCRKVSTSIARSDTEGKGVGEFIGDVGVGLGSSGFAIVSLPIE